MKRLLSNLSINTLLTTVVVLFGVFILVVAGLGHATKLMSEDSIGTLNQINVEQVSEIARAESLLLKIQLSLRDQANAAMFGGGDEVQVALAQAGDMLARAEERFAAFQAVPKTEQGRAYTEPLTAAFSDVLAKVQAQLQALKEGNAGGFQALKGETQASTAVLNEAMTAFIRYAEERGEALMADYRVTASMAEMVILAVVAASLLMLLALRMGLVAMVVRPLNKAVESLERIAQADLSQEIKVLTGNEIGKLFAAMRDMQQGLSKTVGTVRDSSGSIHIGTREIASGNADLSSRTEQQAASIEETAASMEQLTATVKQNADNARQASTLANDASSTAGRGGEVVDQVISTMHGISGSSKKIADITGVIDSIAFQTNILALNASVEAARAGEQGRGFAVVAGEVRNLASRSASAAKEIKSLIDSSVAQVQQGSTLVEEAGSTMREVVSAVRRVTDIMDEISAASQEQSDGIEQVNTAITQMDEVTQQNAALVQQAAAAAASLEEQASRLEQAVAVFRLSGRANDAAGAEPALPRPSQPALAAAKSSKPSGKREMVTESGDDWEEF
ncbi:methyl-accepting chemotaxis sensory transducer with TarH sensor [Modicisalibacter muralis]|uniref:Methyl-accepting chemotaxis sensory transducer with TarH sensor n=1 Tax=Modicisalibacter muralis TaxID=119000 RepID=A0A1G9FZQ7_9GAMM|nr:methyl-accepting chemotaxis protein [Halomonas muralis]SDK93884.1 methyl-accepting chemotaxis sensory transducer with TarH sensor [Halomonas muralis]